MCCILQVASFWVWLPESHVKADRNICVCFVLFKDMLKHTPEDHPDYSYLLDAQRDIKRLAERINKGRRSAEEAEREARVIQEIEAHIEGVEHVRYLLMYR